jgi:hypothetical protein
VKPHPEKYQYTQLALFSSILIGGLVFLCGFALLVHYASGNFLADTTLSIPILVFMFIATFVVIWLSNNFYKKNIRIIQHSIHPLKNRMGSFSALTMIHIGYCEFPGIISAMGYLCFGNYLFFIPPAICIIEMIRKFPTRQKIDEMVCTSYF